MPCSSRDGEADVVGRVSTLAVLLDDVGTVELGGRDLDQPGVRRGGSVVHHEDHRLGRGGSQRDERLEDRFDLLRGLRASGNGDEGGDGFHVPTIGRISVELERFVSAAT